MSNALETMLRPANIPTGRAAGQVAKVQPASFRLSSGNLGVTVVSPQNPQTIEADAGGILDWVIKGVELAEKLWGSGSGGDGQKPQKCETVVSQIIMPGGMIVTTQKTTCTPA